MGKNDAALNNMAGMFRPKPHQVPEQAANVVTLTPEPEATVSTPERAASASKPVRTGRRAPAPGKGTVAATAKRTMLYLPPKAKRKFKEMAFHDDRKEHDVYMDALREYLEKHGHKGLL